MLEKIAYVLLGSFVVFCVLAYLAGAIVAFPWGLIYAVPLVALILLLVKAIRDRLENKEDDFYDQHIHQ